MIKIGCPLKWNLDHAVYVFKDADSVVEKDKTYALIVEYVKRQILKLFANLTREKSNVETQRPYHEHNL
jgi:hypothetical protein